VRSDQYSSDPEGGEFFLRMEFTVPSPAARARIEAGFGAAVGAPFAMSWRLWEAGVPKRIAIVVSGEEHCLLDLLWRWRRRDLEAEVALVISNHEDAAPRR
jgi:formyltetrahydrofolate deformylase